MHDASVEGTSGPFASRGPAIGKRGRSHAPRTAGCTSGLHNPAPERGGGGHHPAPTASAVEMYSGERHAVQDVALAGLDRVHSAPSPRAGRRARRRSPRHGRAPSYVLQVIHGSFDRHQGAAPTREPLPAARRGAPRADRDHRPWAAGGAAQPASHRIEDRATRSERQATSRHPPVVEPWPATRIAAGRPAAIGDSGGNACR